MFLLLWREGLLTNTKYAVAAVVLIYIAVAVRAVCLPHVTKDYTDFLAVWVKTIRSSGGFAALSKSIGNYNLPYIYLLTLISYIKTDPLIPIKLISIAFDILLAWSAMKIVGLFSGSKSKKLFAFFAVMLLPTVVLNGAYWGQCDSIYASLALLGIYFALKGRPSLAVISIALSFAFKLQAIFILHIFAVFLL
jgi:Gpi18-like mannosyltransferase